MQTRLTNAAVDRARARTRPIPLFDHGIAFLPGPGRRDVPRRDEPPVAPRAAAVDGRARRRAAHGRAARRSCSCRRAAPDDHGVDATWTLKLAAGRQRASSTARSTRIGRRRVLDAHVPDRAGRARAVGRGPPRRPVVPDGRGRQEGRLPGRPARTARRRRWKARSRRARAARGTGARRAAVAVADAGVADRAARQAHAARVAPAAHGARARSRGRSASSRRRAGASSALPQGGDENGGAFGRAHLEVARDPHDPQAVVVKRTMVFDQSVIPVDEYPRVARVGAAGRRADAQGRAPRAAREVRDEGARRSLGGSRRSRLLACGGPGARAPQAARGELAARVRRGVPHGRDGRSARRP